MKPIKVVMSAFGSYANVVEVTFDKVNQGIFLITGDTGAGKTTIFDAIAYALYDETSGGKRDGDMMRSEYAQDDTPTFVELTFEYQDKEYTIKRNPNYARLSKRRNKEGELTLTQESATVELIMPDGRPFHGKVKETNAKIVEIIGLDVNQFTQIAMIAQGEFMKLLHAPSKERKEIFARIFNTKIYYRIQKELSDRAKNQYRTLDDNLKAIQFELGKVSLCSDSSYQEEWKLNGSYQESAPENVLTLMALIRQEMLDKDIILHSELTKEKESLESVKEQITKGQELNQLFDALEETMRSHERLLEKKDDIRNLQTKCVLARKAEKIITKELLYHKTNHRLRDKQRNLQHLNVKLQQLKQELAQLQERRAFANQEFEYKTPNLSTLITRLQDALPCYEKLDLKRKELAAAKQEEATLSFNLTNLLELQLKEKQQLEGILLHQEALKSSETKLITLTQQLKDLKAILDDLNGMQVLLAEITELEIKERAAKEATKQALLLYQTKSQMYEQKNEAFILEQVGIIALKLEPMVPCPVCGSTSHPQKAVLSEHAVTQQDVETAKKEREAADEAKNRQSEALQEMTSKVTTKKTLFDNLYQRIFEEESEDLKKSSLVITQKQADTRSEFAALKTCYQEEEKHKKDYEANQLRIKELTLSLESQEQTIAAIKESLGKAQTQVATVSKEEALLAEGLPYDTVDRLQQNLAAHKKAIQSLEQAKKTAEDNYGKQQEGVQQLLGNLESEQKELEQVTGELEGLLSDYQQAIAEQGFEHEEDYLAHKCENSLLERMEEEIKNHELEVSRVEANLKIYQKQTENKERVVLSELMAKRQIIQDKVAAYETKEKEYYLVGTNNHNIEVKLKQLIEKRTQIRVEYERMNRLDRTANGKLSGMAGLDFQTYIQRRYFNHIIHEANRRLSVMTSNRFILTCREFKDLGKQGEVGLDLDVYSLVTDKTRDVKTLSGGESFMAALAMALGMADVIQHTAGKIHLDTMFIDEGFGSLDDESRSQAIKILNELAGDNRLVGIISHVTELKEQIDRKLVVKKDQAGSSVRWVY